MLLELSNLSKRFTSGLFLKRSLTAVNNVDLDLERGETLAVIGESGSGKSTLAQLILGLIAPSHGSVRFDAIDPFRPTCGQLALRRRLQAVFQDADGSLNPHLSARDLLLEPLFLHGLVTGRPEEHCARLLDSVQLTADILPRYPFELSGGQRQRLGIARAMSLSPELLVADEPTASLDPSVQAHILDILCRLKVEQQLSCLYITHELTTVRFIADRVAVLYAGQIVELGTTAAVLDNPAHPYTRHLVAASSGIFQQQSVGKTAQPYLASLGCPFVRHCPNPLKYCPKELPALQCLSSVHRAACHMFACN